MNLTYMNNDGCWNIISYYYNDYSAKPEIIFESIKGLQINYPVSTREVGEKVIRGLLHTRDFNRE